jgi:hypothetical protein
VRTTPAVSAVDMSDDAMLVEMMTSDDVVGEDAAPAVQRQTAAFAAAGARWGIDATERSASWEVRHHPSGADPILMTQENPAGLSRQCGASRADAACTRRRTDRQAWR